MERRLMLAWMGGLGMAGGAASATQAAAGDAQLMVAQADMPAHDHHAMMEAQVAPRKYDGVIPAYQDCTRAAVACISHCQQLLAQGDKALGTCLRTALDTEAVCSSVLQLAGLNSQFTPAVAKVSIAVMQSCVDACKEHVDHHAACKACHDACLKAIEAAKTIL